MAVTASIGEQGRLVRFWNWAKGTFVWWLLFIPVIHFALVKYLSSEDLLFFQESAYVKQVFEIIHPSLLFVTMLLCWQGWRLSGRFAFGWLALFASCMFCREVHFEGSSVILVVGSLTLLAVAVRRTDERRAFLERRWACSFYFMGLICYLISQLLDRGILKHVIRWVTQDSSFKIFHSSNVEESMESLGGLFLLLTPLFL